jgi:nitrate/nitrite transporter NarK
MQKDMRIHGIFTFILVVCFLAYDQFMRATPQVVKFHQVKELQLPHDLFGLMTTVAVYVFFLAQIPVGILFDHINSRILLPIAISCSSVGMFFMGWSAEPIFSIAAKVFLMIGAPFTFIAMLIVAARWFPHEKFGTLSGIGQFFSTFGVLVGGVPLGLLMKYYISWRVVMVVMGTVGVILVLMCLLIVQDCPSLRGPDRAGKHRYLKELKLLFASKQMWAIGVYAFCGWGAVIVFAKHWAIPFLEERFLITESHARHGMMVFWLAAGVLSPFMGYLSDRWKRRIPFLVFSSAIGLTSSLFLLYFSTISIPAGILVLFFLGLSVAAQILTFAFVKDLSPSTSLGASLGLNVAMSVVGGLVCNYLVNGILTFFIPGPNGYYPLSGYRIALAALPFFFLAGLCIALFFLRETRCRESVS